MEKEKKETNGYNYIQWHGKYYG